MTWVMTDELERLRTALHSKATLVWRDELGSIISNCVENIISEALGDIVRTFTDKTYSTATITIHETMREKRDPRNPNPHAGKSKIWVVRADNKKVGKDHGSYDSAFIAAQSLHNSLIRSAEKALSKNPEFGCF